MKRLGFLLALFSAFSMAAPVAAAETCAHRAERLDHYIAEAQAGFNKAVSQGNAQKASYFAGLLASLTVQRAALPC